MSRFMPGDRVLYCPFYDAFRSEPCEAQVLSVDRHSARIQLPIESDEVPEERQLEIGEHDLYLLEPQRRPFLEDVERTVRHRFHRRAGPVVRRWWTMQSRLSTGHEDDAALTALLRQMKAVRAQGWADGDRALAEVRDRLHAEITGPDAWREKYRSWLFDEPPPWNEADHDAAEVMRERCVAAAERLGLDEVDL